MKNKWILAALAAAVGMTATASAQKVESGGSNLPPQYLTGRAGILFPIDDRLRDASNTFVGLGLDYTFSNAFLDGETFVSLDWMGRTKGGGRLNAIPICINERFFLSHRLEGSIGSSTNRAYAFVGLGAVIIDADTTTTRFAGRGGLGVEFNKNFVAEAAVYLSTAFETAHFNAIGVYLGYRFFGGS